MELFAAQFDPYEYKDNFNDSKEALDEIESSLLAGKTEGLKNFFEQVIGEEDEYSALAYECLFRIEEFEKKHFPKEPFIVTAREMIDILAQTPITDSLTGILEENHEE